MVYTYPLPKSRDKYPLDVWEDQIWLRTERFDSESQRDNREKELRNGQRA